MSAPSPASRLARAPTGTAVATEGVPCVFEGCSGFYHPAGGASGVVLCAPWGFEDLTLRKSWRLLAEAIAAAGYPCLRFDYPGTGNSLGDARGIARIEDWVGAIGKAAETLRRLSGVRRFVFLGQSLGATLAAEAARGRGDVAALQLIAPVVKGRAYVRELGATANLVADRIGIAREGAPGVGLSVLGFELSPSLLEGISRLDLLKNPPYVPCVTIFDPADRKAGAEAREALRSAGASVTHVPIAPFHVMVSDATVIQPLPVPVEVVVAQLQAVAPVAPTPPETVPAFHDAMVGPGFREEPIRFGPEQALFGIFCRPARPRPDTPAVLLLNRGLNAHIGWRRVSVEHARALAAVGIASLRFDVAGLGESRDAPGRPPNLIYSELLLPDVRAAIDALAARGHARIVLAGVCSGAYMALMAAQADPRVTDVVAVNAQRIVWNPAESFEDVVRYGLRTIDDYIGDIKGRGALRKLVRSRHRIVPAMRFLAVRSVRTTLARVPLAWRSRLMRNSMAARVFHFFATIESYGTRVSLVFSAGDPGLVELRNYFGPLGRDLPFANVSVCVIPDADHNLTNRHASDAMLGQVIGAIDGVPIERQETRANASPARLGARAAALG